MLQCPYCQSRELSFTVKAFLYRRILCDDHGEYDILDDTEINSSSRWDDIRCCRCGAGMTRGQAVEAYAGLSHWERDRGSHEPHG